MEHRKKKKSKTQQKSKLSKAQKRRSNESLQPVGSGSGEKQSPRTRKARKQRSVTSLEKSDSAENLNKSSHQKVRRKLTPEPNGRGRPARERSIFDIIRLKRNSQAEDKNLSRSSESTAKTMKSRRPTPRSMMKLTSRVKRRDEQVMKKRGSLSGEREDGKKKDSREGLPKNIPKKSEDNYREVFPQVKLWFDSETPRNPRHSREELESEPSLQIAMISSREPELYSTAPDTTKTARAYTSDICTAQIHRPNTRRRPVGQHSADVRLSVDLCNTRITAKSV
ncbi:hypothetical protein Q1695_008033 [Nippostrongylus brasiliensis]|nr:hypothetical protein Q1695_008033 [Nippostrongylus brasiliensis]